MFPSRFLTKAAENKSNSFTPDEIIVLPHAHKYLGKRALHMWQSLTIHNTRFLRKIDFP